MLNLEGGSSKVQLGGWIYTDFAPALYMYFAGLVNDRVGVTWQHPSYIWRWTSIATSKPDDTHQLDSELIKQDEGVERTRSGKLGDLLFLLRVLGEDLVTWRIERGVGSLVGCKGRWDTERYAVSLDLCDKDAVGRQERTEVDHLVSLYGRKAISQCYVP
jgi:hypothetical protein